MRLNTVRFWRRFSDLTDLDRHLKHSATDQPQTQRASLRETAVKNQPTTSKQPWRVIAYQAARQR